MPALFVRTHFGTVLRERLDHFGLAPPDSTPPPEPFADRDGHQHRLQVQEDIAFRQEVADKGGLGFMLASRTVRRKRTSCRGCFRRVVRTTGKSGAPKGTILELSLKNLCQACHRLMFPPNSASSV